MMPLSFDPVIDVFQPGVHFTVLEEAPGFTHIKDGPRRQFVFIAHGLDEAAKERVARFIEKLGLVPVILHEQPSESLTIIQKLERDARKCSYAIGLLTPDNLGGSRADVKKLRDLRFQARQNVILELGFFLGKLNRSKVCALYKEGVELPSDLDGVLYVKMDEMGGWQLELARELRHAGLDIDAEKLFQPVI